MEHSETAGRGAAHKLHVLVARLDRSADRILRAAFDISYPRFLVLLTLHRIGAVTQRALADELGLTEPTVSRVVASLAQAGLISVTTSAGGGNRRSVALTDQGLALAGKGGDLLEESFRALVDGAGVDYPTLLTLTDQLLDSLGGPS